jgi:hypothetical protein
VKRVVLGAVLIGLVACRASEPPAEYRPTATIKDIMDSTVDPSADVIWESVAIIISATGTEEKAPHTDEEWKSVRRAAIRIIEATNLIQIPGRRVARPGEKSENPKIELGPDEIEQLIAQDPRSFVALAHRLHDAGTAALTAIDARDASALLTAGERLDTACENCHLKYWYPPGHVPTGGGSVR